MLHSMDLAVLYAVNRGCSNAFFDKVMPLITRFGDLKVIIFLILAASILFFKRKNMRMTGLLVLVGLVVSEAIVHLLKGWIARPRPFITLHDIHVFFHSHGGSFPSGHATAVFLVATVVYARTRKAPYLYLGALAVAFSRIYLGVHYPTDVIAGGLIGTAVGLGVVWGYKRLSPRQDTPA